jgi:hypothetical protein
MGSVDDTKAAYAIHANDSSVHAQMTADFFGATLTASSNDVQEKSDHGKKEQVEEAQVEASGGEGQAEFGRTHVREEERRKKEITPDEGKEKGRGKGKEGRQKSSAQEEGNAGSAEARCQEGRTKAEACANGPGADGTACNAALGARNASGDEFRRGIIGNVDCRGSSRANAARAEYSDRLLGAYQPLQGARAAAVREYSFGQSIGIDVHMLVEHGFKYAAQIERGAQVAISLGLEPAAGVRGRRRQISGLGAQSKAQYGDFGLHHANNGTSPLR